MWLLGKREHRERETTSDKDPVRPGVKEKRANPETPQNGTGNRNGGATSGPPKDPHSETPRILHRDGTTPITKNVICEHSTQADTQRTISDTERTQAPLGAAYSNSGLGRGERPTIFGANQRRRLKLFGLFFASFLAVLMKIIQ